MQETTEAMLIAIEWNPRGTEAMQGATKGISGTTKGDENN
jgi:hypothetical protein